MEETHVFDGKRLPSKNKDIAVDVCAMTVDGGTLLYGVDENEHDRITNPAPIELAGQRERIDQIVQTSVMEPPTIRITELPTEADPSVGYIVVQVPQSPRAPHQVIVGNDMRFYGRGATGNRRLTEGEIAALYERREVWGVQREALLDAVIQDGLFTSRPTPRARHLDRAQPGLRIADWIPARAPARAPSRTRERLERARTVATDDTGCRRCRHREEGSTVESVRGLGERGFGHRPAPPCLR